MYAVLGGDELTAYTKQKIDTENVVNAVGYRYIGKNCYPFVNKNVVLVI